MERRLFMRFPGNRPKAFTLSYDDGVVQDIRFMEILNRNGLKCTFNLNSELLGTKGILPRENQRISHYKIHPDDVSAQHVAAFLRQKRYRSGIAHGKIVL